MPLTVNPSVLDEGVRNIQAADLNESGAGYASVSDIGLATLDVTIPNNGADYGPDTPGTTTTGVQDAINAYYEAGGGLVVLTGGAGAVYPVRTTVTQKLGVNIDGGWATLQNASSSLTTVFQTDPAVVVYRQTVSRLVVDYNFKNKGTPITVPGSTVAYTNPSSTNPMVVYSSGGTVSAVVVGSITSPKISGIFVVPPSGTIAWTYSSVPTAYAMGQAVVINSAQRSQFEIFVQNCNGDVAFVIDAVDTAAPSQEGNWGVQNRQNSFYLDSWKSTVHCVLAGTSTSPVTENDFWRSFANTLGQGSYMAMFTYLAARCDNNNWWDAYGEMNPAALAGTIEWDIGTDGSIVNNIIWKSQLDNAAPAGNVNVWYFEGQNNVASGATRCHGFGYGVNPPTTVCVGTVYDTYVLHDISSASLSVLANTYSASTVTRAKAMPGPWNAASATKTGQTDAETAVAILCQPDKPSGALQLYRVSAGVNVTAWTTPASFNLEVTYNDEGANPVTKQFALVSPSNTSVFAITTTGDYIGLTMTIWAVQGTNINIKTAGTFTGTPVYDFWGAIELM